MSGIIKGNFTGQPGGVFPVDVETFAAMQSYIDAVSVLVSIVDGVGGKQDGMILSGCQLSSDGMRRSAGWLVLTGAHSPHLVYYEGGSVDDNLYEVEEPIDVEVGGVVYNAYVKHIARAGTGVDPIKNYKWQDISGRVGLWTLEQRIDAIRATMPAVGSLVLYGGESYKVTEDGRWLLCDGYWVKKEHYPELYAVIGDLYNGDEYYEGSFRLPNLKIQIKTSENTYVERYYIIRAK